MAELRPDVVLHSEETRCETEESNILTDHQPLPQPGPVDHVSDTEGKGEKSTETESRSAPEKLSFAEDVVLLR